MMIRMMKILAAVLAVLCVLPLDAVATGGGQELRPPPQSVPRTLFGMHIHRAASTTPWPTVPFGTWRLWDAHVAWPWLEPQKGHWQFDDLDKLVALAEKNGVEVLLPLGLTPNWASARASEFSAFAIAGAAAEARDMEDWKTYVRTVARRYKGRVRHFEVWNEPNYRGFFTGTPAKMVELARVAYRVLKEVDPDCVVVSPSVGIADNATTWESWLDEFLALGGGAYCDVLAVHIYVSPAPPEAMLPTVTKVRRIMAARGVAGKPLWNTEAGWLIANRDSVVPPQQVVFTKVLNDSEAAAYIARMYLVSWAAGIERYYFYAWDNKVMGLTEADGVTVKPPAKAYGQLFDWLTGARMVSCSVAGNGTWTARIVRGNGYEGWIVWNPDGVVPFTIPREWRVGSVRHLDGSTRSLNGRMSCTAGPQPVLLEQRGRQPRR